MIGKILYLLLLISTCLICLDGQSIVSNNLDVISYSVYLEPVWNKQHIKGNVTIKFKTLTGADKVTFDSGGLIVTKLEGEGTSGFEQKNNKVIISLSPNDSKKHEIRLFYNGKPKRGLVFTNVPQELYTVYFTNEWMICNSAPSDKATIEMELLVPNQSISIASGVLKDTVHRIDNKTLYSWRQDYESPSYTYGFMVGAFNEFHNYFNDIQLKYYAKNHTPKEIEKIFQYTSDMLSFFEEKSGIPYPQSTYSQILVGNHYQEMSGFSILKKTYGQLVLNDSTETNLISHELAHQWWGNRITCRTWNHFWLNEGFATFMSAAYNEHRFGKIKYQQDIDAYSAVYSKIKLKGGDKSLVFSNWLNPSTDDRNLVYFKGAYVLHLLKEELGDKSFWAGIKYYSQKFYGKSVTTKDFQSAMEESSNRRLDDFFNEWIY